LPDMKDRQLYVSSFIKCECGAEILLLPDLRVMNHAIEVHVSKHREKEKSTDKAEAESKRIQELLITQVFEKALGQDKKR